jgi:hypothetical protein
MWKAAGWMAVIISGLLLGIDPTDYRYSYEIGGYADGPSAGALMTVATLAAILGHPLRADATLTGTINPDGTVGPVGGIPHKVDGAAAAGKKLVLIPAGQRRSRDEQRKQLVDVVERGQGRGIEVREVSDVYEAYQLLTGQPLPRPEQRRDSQPALPDAAGERTRAKAKEWRARYDQQVAQFKALPPRLQLDPLKAMLAAAARDAERADRAEQQGPVGAAYQHLLSANAQAAVAVQTGRVLQSYVAGDVMTASTRLRALKPSMKIDTVLEQIERQTPATLSDVVALADAHGNLGLALGLVELGDAIAGREAVRTLDTVEKFASATQMYVLAGHLTEVSRDALDLGLGAGAGPAPERAAVQRLADLFRRAAEANLNYFDQIVLSELAQEEGLHLDVVRGSFADREPLYLLASASARAMKLLEKRSRQETAGVYATLGGGLHSYVLSSLLVAKYYSLGARLDRDGGIKSLANEAALGKMLDFAEGRARDVLAVAVAAGGAPVQPVINYQSARVSREGDLAAKLSALSGYWSAALQGQMLGILSDQARLVR